MGDDIEFEVRPIELTIVSGPASGVSRQFDTTSILVGRSPECGLQVDDPTVSRLHFSISFVRGRWELTDAGSSSGTAVNGEVTGEVGSICVVHDGDRISAGRSVFVVSIVSERQDAAIDADFDPAISLELSTPAVIRPAQTVRKPRLKRWLPWFIIAVALAFIAAFVAGSC